MSIKSEMDKVHGQRFPNFVLRSNFWSDPEDKWLFRGPFPALILCAGVAQTETEQSALFFRKNGLGCSLQVLLLRYVNSIEN